MHEGNAGLYGGPAGDLYLHLSVSPHPHFRREGDHIVCDLALNFAQAALGDSVEVPTIDGPSRLEVPAGTQHGMVFRLRGKGVPRRGGRRGDHLVRISVVTPTSLGERERQLFEELKRSLGGGEAALGKGGKGLFGRFKRAL
jgi:molecular chaperone DnaJ